MKSSNEQGIIRRHWAGGFSLGIAFWLILVTPLAAVYFLQSNADKELARLGLDPTRDQFVTVAMIVALWVLLVWQVVGVLRSADRYMVDDGERSLALSAQGVALLSVLLGIILSVDSWQALQQRTKAWHRAVLRNLPDDYLLQLTDASNAVRISGSMEVGVTLALAALLDANSAVRTIDLDSPGGRVYEGRALLKLIRSRGLDTRVSGKCYSACAIAFMGGERRTVAPTAELGFHQYRSFTVQPNVNVTLEQEKDVELLVEQGVTPEFANAVFTVSSDEIWIPPASDLRAFGVTTN